MSGRTVMEGPCVSAIPQSANVIVELGGQTDQIDLCLPRLFNA